MLPSEKNYYVNNPIFVKYKKRFDLAQMKSVRYLKSVFINERIIEIPFAIQCLSALPHGKQVLDLGCTESTLPLQLAALGYQVMGYDFREYPYKHPNLQYAQGDILALPFADECYDAVTGISVIEHIGIGFYDDPRQGESADKKAMFEIRRVLKTGGMLVLTVPYGVAATNGHHRIYDERLLGQLLKDFQIQEMRYFKSSFALDKVCNAWVEITKEAAAKVESDETAKGVCLVKAVK